MYLQYRIDQETEKIKKDAVKKTILGLKENGMSESAILNTIIKHYGDEFSKDQLEKFITEIK